MKMTADMSEYVNEYISSLKDLVDNRKQQITLLTILAEEYKNFAKDIVQAIENRIQEVDTACKLPVLYLIDSIIKNLSPKDEVYLRLFSENIVYTFCSVFLKCDETLRLRMWKLRQTWNDIFPPKKLYELDAEVKKIDHAWPITQRPEEKIAQQTESNSSQNSSKIHINPKIFFAQQKASQLNQQNINFEKELWKKQQELNELQKQKLEMQRQNLELLRLQKQNSLVEELQPQIISELEKLKNDGTIKLGKPDVPADEHIKVEMKNFEFNEKLSDSNEKRRCAPRLLPADPRLKTAAALQNGGKNISIVLKEEPQAKLITIDDNRSRSNSESSLFNISPIRPREAPAQTPCFEIDESLKNNAGLLLKTNESNNKSIDNERSNNRKNKTSIKKSEKSGEQESKTSSPSKSSSSTRSSSSSKSKEQSSSSSSSSSRKGKSRSNKSSSSSSSSSSSPHKKSSSKSRKRSRSPSHHHYHHHHQYHHSSSKELSEPQLGLDEEEQIGGSVVVSLPQSQVLGNIGTGSKDGKESLPRKDGSNIGSPGSSRKDRKSSQKSNKNIEDSTTSQDEDLRPVLVGTPETGIAAGTSQGVVATAALATKDLDLRVLPPIPINKRKSDQLHQTNTKRRKEEVIDELFGKEDVDLRLLAPVPQTTLKPLSPPHSAISSDKENSTKFKKSEKSSDTSRSFSDSRFNRDQRINRPKPYNKCNSPDQDLNDRGRRNIGRDYERNSDRNIEIIMRQAAEQLGQGAITKIQYNKLIQDVLQMSEDQKLRAAQRKDRETKGVWDRNDKGVRSKDHGMHMRHLGPRWPQWHQAWSHPTGPPFQGPPFRPEFRPPMGPWQNHPRMPFGPIRPDFPHPQFHGGFNPRIPHPAAMGPPNGHMMIPNGPHNSMVSMNSMASNNMMGSAPPSVSTPASMMNGAKRSHRREIVESVEDNSTWGSLVNNNISNNDMLEDEKMDDSEEIIQNSKDELPEADPKILEEIAKDPMKSLSIDEVSREIRFYGDNAIIFMSWEDPRDVGFKNGARKIFIDGKDVAVCSFNDDYREFTYEGEVHKIKLGAPTRELFIDDKWYQCYFGGAPITVELGNKKVSVKLDGPAPHVKIGTVKRTDLVLGKINLIINAKIMYPVFLDAKPQVFTIENKPVILEFVDSLQTVLLNGRPFNVEFGGLPKPITTMGKKHYIRFSVLPRPYRPGYVKINGMKGSQPEVLSSVPISDSVKAEEKSGKEEPSQNLTDNSSGNRSPIETDSTSQQGLDQTYVKTDLELDVLSSVVPSGMAPSSGFSYQAESAESIPPSDPNDVNQLFQRLVETGLVLVAGSMFNLSETKKSEEEVKKEPEVDPISFDKLDTLKTKRPEYANILYSGMQCSSCGLRFPPELATKYSRHLDWHFRQNRLKKDSSRKLNSRTWFYLINDWTQYEECEDVEDRGQIWFDTEKQLETEAAAAEELYDEAAQPSVPTGSEEDGYCLVCREAFSQFYDDEKDEWHYRPAVSFENKNFHPCCLEDHKRALSESAACLTTASEDIKDDIKMEVDENEKPEIDDKNQGDENQQNEEESMDIKDIKLEVSEEKNEESNVESTLKTESDDALTEPLTEVIENLKPELDDAVSDDPTVEQSNKEDKPEEKEESEDFEQKEQETNEGELSEKLITEEDSLLNEEPANIEEAEERPTVDSTQVAVKSTIDGNVEHEDAPSTIPVAPTKIKINISIPMNSPKESKETKEENDPEEKSDEELEEEQEEVIPQPASIKPTLLERNLKVLPLVEKDHELSGLCSIM